ncbi:Lipase 3 [Halotydeus destructor]|nr:Lipase 3 [Halotydeus destructor]
MLDYLNDYVPEFILPLISLWLFCVPIAVALLITALIVFVVSKTIYNVLGKYNDADVKRTDEELIKSRGFHFEEHRVTTKDGYQLVLHRVVNPLIKKYGLPIKPVLFVHGMGGTSSVWIINDTDGFKPLDLNGNVDPLASGQVGNTTAFTVANHGYDVWLGNYRGTPLSSRHVKWTQSDSEYWNYSMDEVSSHDMPTMVDHILETTGQKRLGFVGISQGNTVMFGLLASRPEYNSKIAPFVAITPVVSVANTLSSIPKVIRHAIVRLMIWALIKLGDGSSCPAYIRKLALYFTCSHPFTWLTNYPVHLAIAALGGGDLMAGRDELYVSRLVGSFARKTLTHTLQLLLTGVFAKFDHGQQKNIKVYGSPAPPVYELDNITNESICFIHAKNDTVVNYEDVKLLQKRLPVKLMDNYLVPNDKWNHADYHCGKNLAKYLNARLISNLALCD